MIVVFAIPSGPQIKLECNPNEKIHDILLKIKQYFHIQNYYQTYLVYQGKKLNENDEFGIINYIQDTKILIYTDNQKINFDNNQPRQLYYFHQQRFIEVSFSLISGRNITIKCNPCDTINDVLSSIKKELDIESCNTFKFIYNGRILDITKKINDIDYVNGNTIIVNAN